MRVGFYIATVVLHTSNEVVVDYYCFNRKTLFLHFFSSVSAVRVRLRQRERRAQVFPNLPPTLLDSGGGETSLLRRWTSLSPWTHITISPVDTQHLYISVILYMIVVVDGCRHYTSCQGAVD